MLWLSFFFLLGLICAHFTTLTAVAIIALILLGSLLVLIEKGIGKERRIFKERPRFSPLPWGVLLITFSIGFIRQQTVQCIQSSEQAEWNKRSGSVMLTGIVAAPPVKSERMTQVRLEVRQLFLEGGAEVNPVSGMVLLLLSKNSPVKYGDQLQIQGKMTTPYENADFSYKDYLARQGIYSLMAFPRVRVMSHHAGNPFFSFLYDVRETAYQTLRQMIPMPEAAVLAGILLGMENDIPEYLYQAYQASGTAHILIISGFNIAILSAIIARFFRRLLPYGWDALASTATIIVYTLLVGAEPPVVRAAIMGIIALPAYLLGRRSIHLNVLVFTAALMLFFSPSLLQDISFQLSFLATLGIMVFSDPMQEFACKVIIKEFSRNEPSKWVNWVNEYLLVTLAAQIAVLPVLLGHFDFLSLVSLPANLLILPIQPLVMGLGGTALITGLVFLPIGSFIGKIAWLPVYFSDQIALWMGSLPFAMLRTSSKWSWIAWVVLIALFIPALRYHFQHGLKGYKSSNNLARPTQVQ